jgi:hypothetical protein
MESHRWWSQHQLGAKWGGVEHIPAAIMRGVEVYDSALNAVQAFDIRAQQKRSEEEAERRTLETQGGVPRRRLPQFRRR